MSDEFSLPRTTTVGYKLSIAVPDDGLIIDGLQIDGKCTILLTSVDVRRNLSDDPDLRWLMEIQSPAK